MSLPDSTRGRVLDAIQRTGTDRTAPRRGPAAHATVPAARPQSDCATPRPHAGSSPSRSCELVRAAEQIGYQLVAFTRLGAEPSESTGLSSGMDGFVLGVGAIPNAFDVEPPLTGHHRAADRRPAAQPDRCPTEPEGARRRARLPQPSAERGWRATRRGAQIAEVRPVTLAIARSGRSGSGDSRLRSPRRAGSSARRFGRAGVGRPSG